MQKSVKVNGNVLGWYNEQPFAKCDSSITADALGGLIMVAQEIYPYLQKYGYGCEGIRVEERIHVDDLRKALDELNIVQHDLPIGRSVVSCS